MNRNFVNDPRVKAIPNGRGRQPVVKCGAMGRVGIAASAASVAAAVAVERFVFAAPRYRGARSDHFDGRVKGLEEWPKIDWPNVPLVFWSFRIMVGIGLTMLALGIWSLFVRWRGNLADAPLLQRSALIMGPSGFIALLAGWIHRTDAASPAGNPLR